MLSITEVLGPLGKEQYKVITYQDKLNEIVSRKILPESQSLRRLKLVITNKLLHLRGIIFEPELKIKSIKPGDIFFDLSFTKEEIHRDEVILKIRKFRIYNPNRRIDLWKLIDRYSNVLREKIMKGLTGENTPFYELETADTLYFDLKYVLNQIPTEANLLGHIAILNVAFEKRRIVWYIESNFVLKSIIDYLGPDYLEVEQVDLDIDALKLLTDLNFDDG